MYYLKAGIIDGYKYLRLFRFMELASIIFSGFELVGLSLNVNIHVQVKCADLDIAHLARSEKLLP